MSRLMVWADIVPLGYYATWAMEPNPTCADYYRTMRKLHYLAHPYLRGPQTRAEP